MTRDKATFTEDEIVAALIKEAEFLQSNLHRYGKSGYMHRRGYTLTALREEITRLKGAYAFAANIFRSKDPSSGHIVPTHHKVFGVIGEAEAHIKEVQAR